MVLLGLGASACSPQSECDLEIVSEPVILVVDAQTGKPICDATIVVTSQSYGEGSGPATETLASGSKPSVDDAGSGDDASEDFAVGPARFNDAGVCVYGGVSAEVATLQVSRQGYRTENVGNVYITTSGCNGTLPAPQVVTVRLTPG